MPTDDTMDALRYATLMTSRDLSIDDVARMQESLNQSYVELKAKFSEVYLESEFRGPEPRTTTNQSFIEQLNKLYEEE